MVITVSRIQSDPITKLVNSGDVVTTQKLKLVLQILEELNRGYRRHLNSVTKKILIIADYFSLQTTSSTEYFPKFRYKENTQYSKSSATKNSQQ